MFDSVTSDKIYLIKVKISRVQKWISKAKGPLKWLWKNVLFKVKPKFLYLLGNNLQKSCTYVTFLFVQGLRVVVLKPFAFPRHARIP